MDAGISAMWAEAGVSDAEFELLTACVQPDRAGAEDALLQAVARGIDWERLVRLAIAHGVSPLLARRLLRVPATGLPDDLRSALDEHLRDNAERNEHLVRVLFDVLDALERRGVHALPFKGQLLGAMAYGDRTARRANDLDLLVHPQDVESACAALESLGFVELGAFETGRPMSAAVRAGYRRYQCEFAFVRPHDNVVVEPHWAIVPSTFAVDLDLEGYWRRAIRVPLGDREVSTPCAQDMLVASCVHASKHEWTRLQWICDVAWLLRSHADLDLGAVLADARARGVERMVLVGLGLARRSFGCELGAAASSCMAADRKSSGLIELFHARLHTEGIATSAVWHLSPLRFAMRERWRDRAAYAWRVATTPTLDHLLIVDLPGWASGLYVPLKLAHDYVALPAWRLARRLRRA